MGYAAAGHTAAVAVANPLRGVRRYIHASGRISAGPVRSARNTVTILLSLRALAWRANLMRTMLMMRLAALNFHGQLPTRALVYIPLLLLLLLLLFIFILPCRRPLQLAPNPGNGTFSVDSFFFSLRKKYFFFVLKLEFLLRDEGEINIGAGQHF